MTKDVPLNRVLGLGFGVAMAFGNTIGVGILRLPGQVAEAVGDPAVFFAVWIVGGVYALVGALNVGELAAMMPSVGGFYVYARRAFGERVGFLVGWNDWVLNVVTLGYALITAAEFLLTLTPHWKLDGVQALASLAGVWGKSPLEWVVLATALLLLAAFLGLHWLGVKVGGQAQNVISASVGLVLVAMAIAGLFVSAPVAAQNAVVTPALPFWPSLIVALRLAIVSYDGWYGAIYMAEETVDAKRNVPRAMIGCAVLVTGLYLLINAGFVHALGLAALSHSTLPAADVAKVLLPGGADQVITVVSLLTILSLVNATFLGAPRILFAVARDGLQDSTAAHVSASGTPRASLLATAVVVAFLLLAGTMGQLIAIAGDLFVLNYLTAYSALLYLRWTAPEAERPFKAPGYPWTTGLVLVGSLGFLIAALWDDPTTGLSAAGLLGVGVVMSFVWRAKAGRPAVS